MPLNVGKESLWKRGIALPAILDGGYGSGGANYMGANGMATDGGRNGTPCMIDDRDGTGDGDGGKEICVIGMPVDGGDESDTLVDTLSWVEAMDEAGSVDGCGGGVDR